MRVGLGAEREPTEFEAELTDNEFIALGNAITEMKSLPGWGVLKRTVKAYLTAIAVQGLDSDEPKEILRAKRDAVQAVFGSLDQIEAHGVELQLERAAGGAKPHTRFDSESIDEGSAAE